VAEDGWEIFQQVKFWRPFLIHCSIFFVTFSAKKSSIVWPSAIWQPLGEHYYHAFINLDTEIVESRGKDVLQLCALGKIHAP
jgi:hypothetical protein